MPGSYLKQVRERLGLTIRQVEELSKIIVGAKGGKEYFISHGWLTKLEKGRSTPGTYTLFSLSAIYRISFAELLSLYGIHLETTEEYAQLIRHSETHLVSQEFSKAGSITTPNVPLLDSVPEETGLLSSMLEKLGEIPVAALKRLGIQFSRYGYIGMSDFMLYPMLRPGSLVLLDERQNKVATGEWRSEYDRPIYFVEIRGGFACSWCKLEGNQLTLIPHPMSPCSEQHFLYPRDAEIIGRVIGVLSRLSDPDDANLVLAPISKD
jgi:transcriptional regulator with XRE-family HTH domain